MQLKKVKEKKGALSYHQQPLQEVPLHFIYVRSSNVFMLFHINIFDLLYVCIIQLYVFDCIV